MMRRIALLCSDTNCTDKMPMTLHCLDGSPPNRAVYLCIEALGLKPERKTVNLMAGEHMTPEYLKMNPLHTVPTLDDNGFIVFDSHAINAYLVNKYGKNDSLYPKDPQKRALVDMRLHFDTGVLFARMGAISFPLLFQKTKSIPEEKKTRVLEAYGMLEKFLEGNDYVAGNEITIADFCCVATVSSLVEALRISADNHPLVKAWLQRCASNMTNYAEAQKGLAYFKAMVDAELGQ